jgi:hypothetical protein
VDYSFTQLMAIYGAIVASLSIGLNLFDRRERRRERRRIVVDFGITTITRGIPKIDKLVFFPLCVMNLGREDVIIVSVEMRYSDGSFHPGAYNEPEASLGTYGERVLPKKLSSGEVLTLQQFTIAAFIKEPIAVIATDAYGQEHRVSEARLKIAIGEAAKYRKQQAVNLT